MSIRSKNKDHLKKHGGVELVEPALAPTIDDPLRFWTNHPTENTIVDLYVFADGENENSNRGGPWSGPFSGRPELIAELAPAIQARLTLAADGTRNNYIQALRTFWRVLDRMEKTTAPDGRTVERLTSVSDLTHLHEAAVQHALVDQTRFTIFVRLADDVRRLMRLGPLMWTAPSGGEPSRQLIPECQAKAIKIAIKQDWAKVRKRWKRYDAIRRGEKPDTLSELETQNESIVLQYAAQNKELQRNWLHLERIQNATGNILPTSKQLGDGVSNLNAYTGLEITLMRALAFPTVEEADIAFHLALMGSGWNPSTLVTGIDATLPERIFQHPKDAGQNVLVIDASEDKGDDAEEDLEVTMQGSKRRAGGRMQFCMGLKKNPASPPAIVAAFLERTVALREQLRQDVEQARLELARLKAEGAPKADLERQFKYFQKLQQGLRNVWLYVDGKGEIKWIDGKGWTRYSTTRARTKVKKCSYLDCVIARLNVEREGRGEEPIARVQPSDFRDIYARWVYKQTGGNVIAVMIALGHASLNSTDPYINNNIFNAENDEKARRFMTHLFQELEKGRIDLTILAQLVRHGPLTPEMQKRLEEYRHLMRSRVKVGCADVKHPPSHVSPDHVEGKWCGTQRCLRECPHARFLPDSVDGIAMRVEELLVMSDYLPTETWMRSEFEKELEAGEYLLAELYPQDAVEKARAHWREKIRAGNHVVPGVGFVPEQEAA